MNRFQPPVGRRPSLSHPLCRGLRFFSPISTLRPRNLVGPHVGTSTAVPVCTTGQAGPAVQFVRASNQRFSFSAPAPVASGSVTAIVCAKVVQPTGATSHELVGTWDSTGSAVGWMLYTSDKGGEEGLGFIVGDGAGGLNLRSTLDNSIFDNNFHILAGAYHTGTGIVRVWQDGAARNGQSASVPASNVASGVILDVGGSSVQAVHNSSSTIAWVAVFNAALTEGEIKAWSSGRWEFYETNRSAMIVVPATPPNSSARVLATGRYRR